VERRLACLAASEMKDPRLVPAAIVLLDDENGRTRAAACYVLGNNWDDALAQRLAEKLSDANEEVRTAASSILRSHHNESLLPTYRKLLEDDTVAAGKAVQLAGVDNYSRAQLLHLFSSTNLPVVATAFTRLRYSLTPDELKPLLTNSLSMARLMGLGELFRIRDKPAVDLMVSLLRDSNEAVRWRVRSDLRELTGQKLGDDPAAYEHWWKENRENFAPPLPIDLRRQRQSRLYPRQELN
jgi:HEAT repeat protein